MAYFGPVSGSVPALMEIPGQHVGSDNVGARLSMKAGDIEHKRNGVTISLRSWSNTHSWRIVYKHLTATEVGDLRDFFEVRVFKFYPDALPASNYTVRWAGTEFLPEVNYPGSYRLSFEIEEVI